MAALLGKVKAALRVSIDALDEAEIMPLIEAALSELGTAGVTMLDEGDPLIVRAVVAYCKAHFGYDNPEAERFNATWESLRNLLSQLERYTEGGDG